MITIPHTNHRDVPVRRVALFHSGGIGSTLVMYYLMKDIVDRDLNVSLNVITLDKKSKFKDKQFAASTAKKCQELTGFDSDKLIVQYVNLERSVGANPGLGNEFLKLKFFWIPFTADSEYPLLKAKCRSAFSLDDGARIFLMDSENAPTDPAIFDSEMTNKPNWNWSHNVLRTQLFEQMITANDAGDSDLLAAIASQYLDVQFNTISEIIRYWRGAEIIYTGCHNTPPASVDSDFYANPYRFFYEQDDASIFQEVFGFDMDTDSDTVIIDEDVDQIDFSTGGVFHYWQKNPLMSKGDARDLYTQFYSQDSDLEELFWYTRSCDYEFLPYYSEGELDKDSDLLQQWDSESFLYMSGQDRFIYQYIERPLHRFLPHCRKCYKCQVRGYGFQEWLPLDDDNAWRKTENAFNPPAQPPVQIPDPLVVYSMGLNESFPGPTASDCRNLGTIDGIATVLGGATYNTSTLALDNSGANSGILSQNLRPYANDNGAFSASIWFRPSRITGTVLGESTTLASTADFRSIIELQDGRVICGFVDAGFDSELEAGTVYEDVITNIVMIFDSEGTLTTYQDGVQTGQASGFVRTLDSNNLRLEVGFGNGNLYYYFEPISSSEGSNDFIGEIKRFSYMNEVLTPAQVARLYEAEGFTLRE